MAFVCDDNALLRYALGSLSEHEAAALRRHVARCTSCAAYLSTMGTPDVSAQARDDSASAVKQLLDAPTERWQFIVSSAEYAARLSRPIAVQELIQACEAVLDRDHQRAVAISDVLVLCADNLDSGIRSRTLQALAWTRRATALHRRGRLHDALCAVEEARARANGIPSADYENALIGFTAADIMREMGDTAEALAEIRRSAETFLRYRDLRRYRSAREVEAATLYRSGDYTAAAASFVSLLNEVPDSEQVVRGRLAANAAQCFVRVGDHERALPLFREAEQIFTALNYPGYVCRITWGRARAEYATGEMASAVETLRSVFDAFASQNAPNEWVRVGIELVEWTIDTAPPSEIHSLCEAIYEEAAKTGLRMQALEALQYLREASAKDDLTPPAVMSVRRFIEDLPASPEAQFHRPH